MNLQKVMVNILDWGIKVSFDKLDEIIDTIILYSIYNFIKICYTFLNNSLRILLYVTKSYRNENRAKSEGFDDYWFPI